MKKLIICLAVVALAFVPALQAGDAKSCDAAKTACADKAKTACADKAKTACPDAAKSASAKKSVNTAKGASLLVKK